MPQRPTSTPNEVFEQPLRQLENLGLYRPPHCTLQRFLALLVDEGIVSEGAAQDYVEIDQQLRYGSGTVTEEHAARVADSVSHDLQAYEIDGDVAKRLTAAMAPRPLPRRVDDLPASEVQADPPSQLDNDSTPEWEEEAAVDSIPTPETTEPTTSRHVRRLAFAGAFLAWSALMVTAGYLGEERISRQIIRFRLRVGIPWLVPPEVRLDRHRRRAASQPDSASAWSDYADLALAQERHAEAIVALHHLVARHPQNSEYLNSLAWLYCTAEDPAARDPLQALALAERAYALRQDPHITDTLAEAAYRNGDIGRAVALEEDALARATGNRAFYQRQLERFREAAGSVER